MTTLETDDYDLAIVGSGFGGSLLAMIARRLGLSVLLLERGRHPRFAIGESTSPLANLLLEELARRYDLPRLLPLTTYGAWRRASPDLVCGLKRGFSYFHHTAGRPYQNSRATQLLVAASPNDEVADTHWLRSDIDEFLMRQAVEMGTEYWDKVNLDAPQWEKNGRVTLTGTRNGRKFSARARLIVDASGPRGFLARALKIEEKAFVEYPATQSLYSHFVGVRRVADMPEFQETQTPPYPPDAAALHHVFDGGWMWVLRFENGVTSAGFAVTDTPLAAEMRLSDDEAAWERLLARFPSIKAQFRDAKAVQPFYHAPRLAYRAAQAAGPGWAMLPSAAAFVDPLFSTGIPLTLLGVERLGGILETAWDSPEFGKHLDAYATATLDEADATADFLSACYASMPNFPQFAALSMFYFTAASYAEMARRLGKPERATRFLACRHPEFGPAMRACTAQARSGAATHIDNWEVRIAEAISCLNVAGLCDPAKRNWYGVDLNDVVASAQKLGLTPCAMRQILRDAPWAQPNAL